MRLKELRERNNLKQKDIAKMLGVDRTTYAKYESGASEPKKDVFITLSNIYGVSVDYLLGHSEPKGKPTPVSGDGLAVRKVALIQKILGLDKAELETLIQVADSVLAKRGE